MKYVQGKRLKLSAACDNCKKRKVKCDRGQPCLSCVKHKIGHSCTYKSDDCCSTNDSVPAHMSKLSETNQSSFNHVTEGNISIYGLGENSQLANDGALSHLNTKNSESAEPATILELMRPQTAAIFVLRMITQRIHELEKSIEGKGPMDDTRSCWGLTEPAKNLTGIKESARVYAQETKAGIQTIGANIVGSPNDVINFYQGYTPIFEKFPMKRHSHGPFSWMSLLKKDNYFHYLWKYLDANTDSGLWADILAKFKQKRKDAGEDDQEFEERAMEKDGLIYMKPYERIVANIKRKKRAVETSSPSIGRAQRNFQFNGTSKLSYLEIRIERELQLIEDIRYILPPRRVIWMLIDIFFSHLYAFFPFLNEIDFKSSVSGIIGPEDYSEKAEMQYRIEKRLDLALVGIMLIVLRLSFLALSSIKEERKNDHEIGKGKTNRALKDDDIVILSKYPIESDLIFLAQNCFDQFQVQNHFNFTIFQLAFFLRVYGSVAPENGDGIDTSEAQLSNGLLIQMAYYIGIHREPDQFMDVCSDKKVNCLARKMWYFLVQNDLFNAYSFGSSPLISIDQFDTKLPFVDKEVCNTNDSKVEEIICSCYEMSQSFYEPMRKILDISLKINGRVLVSDFVLGLNEIELLLEINFGSLQSFLTPFEPEKDLTPVFRVTKLKNYLSLKTFCVSSYFHLFLYYEDINTEVAFFYFKKIFTVAINDLTKWFPILIKNMELYFGAVSGIALYPVIQLTLHRINKIIILYLLRTNVTIYDMERLYSHKVKIKSNLFYRDQFNSLCNLSIVLRKCVETGVSLIATISNWYFLAWKVLRTQSLFLKILGEKSIYEDVLVKKPLQKTFHVFSKSQLDDISEICLKIITKEENSAEGNEGPDLESPNQRETIFVDRISSPNIDYTSSSGTSNAYSPFEKSDFQVPSVESILFSNENITYDNNNYDYLWTESVFKNLEDSIDIFERFNESPGGLLCDPE
ncbi:uncharacterized protein PRCAT00002463001 [Priceomyces carsonii]|uniref:uncharacterized protein n=1 Tax=Priceomyces carsonii TaxID=28549 RepID=UPI002ED7B7D2|nr:unnamed protein product [Priceomyces carsonii]